jgi:hypothetical protein
MLCLRPVSLPSQLGELVISMKKTLPLLTALGLPHNTYAKERLFAITAGAPALYSVEQAQ